MPEPASTSAKKPKAQYKRRRTEAANHDTQKRKGSDKCLTKQEVRNGAGEFWKVRNIKQPPVSEWLQSPAKGYATRVVSEGCSDITPSRIENNEFAQGGRYADQQTGRRWVSRKVAPMVHLKVNKIER